MLKARKHYVISSKSISIYGIHRAHIISMLYLVYHMTFLKYVILHSMICIRFTFSRHLIISYRISRSHFACLEYNVPKKQHNLPTVTNNAKTEIYSSMHFKLELLPECFYHHIDGLLVFQIFNGVLATNYCFAVFVFEYL